MKLANSLTTSLLSCALAIGVLALAPAPAAAQATSTSVKVNIPFAFQVGSQHMPAGLYRIDVVSDHQILLRGLDADASDYALVHSAVAATTSSTGSVVFDRYGTTNYLHQIWTPETNLGFECTRSRAEQETMAQMKNAPTLVELALINDPRR